jgi:hypothetical protein
MAEKPERYRNGPGHGGPARRYSWPPFEPGNMANVRSGFWMSPTLPSDDRAQVEEIAASIRPLIRCLSAARPAEECAGRLDPMRYGAAVEETPAPRETSRSS